MLKGKSMKNRGFSLVELVIVIVILGVIAAIAIPRISSGSKNAGEAALRANLQSIRNAIDWYASDHGGTFPGSGGTATEFINQLTQYSNAAGGVSASLNATTHPFGPYLRNGIPKLPVGATNIGKSDVTIAASPAAIPAATITAATTGWVYNPTTGEIRAAETDYAAY